MSCGSTLDDILFDTELLVVNTGGHSTEYLAKGVSHQ